MSLKQVCCATLTLAFASFRVSFVIAETNSSQPSVISAEAELAAKAIQVPEGFSLKTVASEPNLVPTFAALAS